MKHKKEAASNAVRVSATLQRPMPTAPVAGDRILRLPEVLAMFGVSRTTLYRGIKDFRFPAGVPIGVRAVGWRNSDLQRHIASLGDAGN